MSAAASFFLGCLVTIICAALPFIISSRQLSAEAQQLRKMLNLIMIALESNKLAEFKRDQNGEITAIILNVVGAAKSSSTVTGVGATIRADK